jgi:hypothetical protein
METYFLFIVKATLTLSVFYLAGLLLFRNNTRFAVYRVYLLSSILISLAMPFNKVSFRTPEPSVQVMAPVAILHETIDSRELIETPKAKPQESASIESTVNWPDVANSAYWVIVCLLIARVLYSFFNLAISFSKSEKERLGRYTIIYMPYNGISYSFFHWIFISAENKANTEKKNIIQHEIVHASQYHSVDVLLVELLTAVMWFNPIVWLMRKSIRQLHEYLADEGVVNAGTNILEYQALLVNQVAGDRLISLPSGFNQSLIKKRLTMMTKIKSDQRSVYRLLIMVPLTGLAFAALSFTNDPEVQQSSETKSLVEKTEQTSYLSNIVRTQTPASKDTTRNAKGKSKADKKTSENSNIAPPPPPLVSPPPPPAPEMVTAIAPTNMNVLYLGIDNPLSIAVSGVPSDRLFVTSTNGIVRREGSKYIATPQQIGSAIIQVFAEVNGEKVATGSMEFRVKDIPEPLANIAGIIAGPISKKVLLEQKTVNVIIASFDFDVQFTVTGFKVSATIHGFVREVSSKSSKITEEQKNLFQELSVGDKLYIEDIKAVGPDGKIREMPPIPLTIKE